MTDAPHDIFDLARNGDAAGLIKYLDEDVAPDLTNEGGDSLVMLAAYHGHQEAVRALLERGADPNEANAKGQTPLAAAVFKGQTEIVRALVDYGADPTSGYPSALDAARMFGKEDLIEILSSAS